MKNFDWIRSYSLACFQKDCSSGVIVGIVALPLAMAFAISSGVKPEYGLYTTIVAGFLISLLGGSLYQIGGPTGAFVPILVAIVAQYGYENLLVAGFMAGFLLVGMGILKLGKLVHFIPRPVTIGFTAGIAVIIFFGQVPYFLGLNIENKKDFIKSLTDLFDHLHHVSFYSLMTGMVCLISCLIVQRWFPKIPWAIVGLVVSTVIASLCYPNEVVTIGSAFQGIPSELPVFRFPDLTWEKVTMMIIPALAIAFLGGIESLLSAKVADQMTGTKHNSNQELIGQGIANIVTPLFGGIPATGAIARTATNIQQGATSPISGMIHALFVLLVLVFFSAWADPIPLASFAPVLMIVAWKMSERKEFIHILKSKTGDSIVLCVTFLFTVIEDLIMGVGMGLLLAIFFFVIRMSKEFHISRRSVLIEEETAADLQVCELRGPIFFGSAKQLYHSLTESRAGKVLIICMHHVPYIDTTGEAIFSHLIRHYQQQGMTILISGIQMQPYQVLEKTGWVKKLGINHFFDERKEAIDYAKDHLVLTNQPNSS